MYINKLNGLLAELKISKEELGRRIGYTPAGIRKMFNKSYIDPEKIELITTALGVPADYFEKKSHACDPPVGYIRGDELVKELLIQKDKYIERLEKDIEKLEVECAELRALKKEAK